MTRHCSAKGAKCKSLGRRPRWEPTPLPSAEGAQSGWGGVLRPFSGNASLFRAFSASILIFPHPGPMAQAFAFRAFGAGRKPFRGPYPPCCVGADANRGGTVEQGVRCYSFESCPNHFSATTAAGCTAINRFGKATSRSLPATVTQDYQRWRSSASAGCSNTLLPSLPLPPRLPTVTSGSCPALKLRSISRTRREIGRRPYGFPCSRRVQN